MVEELSTDGGRVEHQLASDLAYGVGGTDARTKEDARRVDCTRAQHDAVARNRLGAPVPHDLDAHDAPSAKEDAPNRRLRADGEVVACAHHSGQECLGGAYAAPLDLVHRVRAHAPRSRFVRVLAVWKARRETRLDERGLPRDPFASRVAADGQRPMTAVPRRVEIEIALEANERRKTALPRPLTETERGPFVVVFGLAAQRHAGVDRRRASDDATSRHPKPETSRIRPMSQFPIVIDERVPSPPHEVGRKRPFGRIVGPRFEQEDRPLRILGDARRDHRSGGSRPDDDRFGSHSTFLSFPLPVAVLKKER
jgi:hypothetical protein